MNHFVTRNKSGDERGSWVLRLLFKNELNKLMSCYQQIQLPTCSSLVTNFSLRASITE